MDNYVTKNFKRQLSKEWQKILNYNLSFLDGLS
jgi:hypothetical protein